MKNARNLIVLAGMLIIASFLGGQGQVCSAENEASSIQQKTTPTSEDLNALETKMSEQLTALKYDPSTKQSKVSYAFDNAGSMSNVVLYYQNNRLIRLEERIYDQNKTQTSCNMFSFDEKNGCFCNTQWNVRDPMKRILTMSEYGLIFFGSNMNLIDLDSNQMKKLIQETKDSLDVLMGHFKDFKYTFEIK